MVEDYNALLANNTWYLVPPHLSQNLVGSKWVFRVKYCSDGSVERYIEHLLAPGFHQQPGIDYLETFSCVVKPATICLILSLVVSFHWSLCQLDVKNPFLQGHLIEEVYMK